MIRPPLSEHLLWNNQDHVINILPRTLTLVRRSFTYLLSVDIWTFINCIKHVHVLDHLTITQIDARKNLAPQKRKYHVVNKRISDCD